MAQPSCLNPGTLLEFSLTESLFLPLLGGQDVVGAEGESFATRHFEEGGQIKGLLMIVQTSVEFRDPSRVGQESIEVSEAHGREG